MKLPTDVSCTKKVMGDNYSFEFSHLSLGYLGRIYIEGLDSQNSILRSDMAVSDTDDPRKQDREAIFKKLSDDISSRMPGSDSDQCIPVSDKKTPLKDRELVQSKLCLCDSCGKSLHTLIMYPSAKSHSDFIDVKRKMFSQLKQMDVDAYILGVPDSDGTAHIYKIWPSEMDLGFVEPDIFNKMVGQLCESCVSKTH